MSQGNVYGKSLIKKELVMKVCTLCGRTEETLEESEARCLYKMTWGPSDTPDNSKTKVVTNVTDWNIVLCQSCKNKAYGDYLTKNWKGNWEGILIGIICAVILGFCGFFIITSGPGPEESYDKWYWSAILILGFAANIGCIVFIVGVIICLVNALKIPLLRIRLARSNKVPTKFTKKVFLHVVESIKEDLVKKKVTSIHGNYALPSTSINGAESRIRSLNLQKEEWIIKLF